MLAHTLFFEELFDVTVCGFIGNRLDRACAVDVVLAEQHLRVLVRNGLVRSRKVEVDIRNLIAIEAEEYGKRDIVSILDERRAADGALLVRKVIA